MALLQSPENLNTLSSVKGKRGIAIRRYAVLESDRSSWRSHWMEIVDYLLPRRGKFLIESQNSRGRKRNSKIIDSTATQALRTMAAGMMSGMTSPARPWFRFSLADPSIALGHPESEWLSHAEHQVRGVLQRSNFYTAMHTVYEELGAFGTAPLYRQADFNSIIRFRPFTAGEYVIAENDLGVVDTVGRHFTMTVAQVYTQFVRQPTGREDWTGVSATTKKLWDEQNFDTHVQIIHMIQPRVQAERADGRNPRERMPYKSIYFELNGDGDDLLDEGGYERMPVYCPRWDVRPGDIYGRSPGMETLGDVKQLQMEQRRKGQAIDKMVDPPMVGASALRGKKTSTLPGSITYVDPMGGSQGYGPAYQVQPRLQEMLLDIQEVQERIQRGFYADLFAMMINSDRRQITATEVVERHEEKLVLLGPVLQRLNTELLDPAVDDALTFANDAGLLRPPPRSLQGRELQIEYISLLAQAQQAVSATAIERVMGFAGNLVAVFPTLTDVVDSDQALRQYAESLGLDPQVLRDEAKVKQLRQMREQQAQQARQLEQAQQVADASQTGAQAAKVLAEADSQNPNLLSRLAGTGTA